MKALFFLLFSIFSFSQQTKYVDFLTCTASLYPNFEEKSISGVVTYEFKVKQIIDTIKIDAKNIVFSDVMINGKSVKFKNSGKTLDLFDGFSKGKHKLTFQYTAIPKQTLYFIGQDENRQIWTQGQGKYTSHWLPSFDDVNEKVIFGITINYYVDMDKFKLDPIALSNGKLNFEKKTISWSRGVNDITRNYQMQKPMSSYLVMLAIGNFVKQEVKSKFGTPLEFYIDKNDYSKFEPTYRYSKQIFDYLEQEIGMKYPWKIYRQVPVRDFLYAGMENTTSTIFSQDFVVDSISFNDKNYINVNAHELAHQWFGDLITAQSGKHHWLQEGFATYYALLAEKEIFGDNYFYNELYDYALQLKNAAKTDTIPMMNENASSLSFYKKGAWALHTLREDIGAKNFQKAVKKYLKKYQYKNVNTDEFLAEIKKVAKDFDIKKFKSKWLETAGFDMVLAESYLFNNKSVAAYIQLTKEKKDLENCKAILESETYFPVKQYIFYKLGNTPFEDKKELIEIGMKQNVYVRQAIAETVSEIPVEFKSQYETFLDDDSYKTKEIALVNLCNSFPNQANEYLEKLKNLQGNNDKSLRITWLKIALNLDVILEYKNLYFNELLNYTSSNNESSVRQNALEVLLELYPENEQVIRALFQATTHHKWQFTKFAKEKIRALLKQSDFRNKVENLVKTADENMTNLYLKFLKE
ncbi:M1 family metallopeptidase [Flavobacterium sp.]|jgi:aminopeptidase N|uniref:M1 family metallopeptidase n=1 Tax=Flavobacterium sp. TaxID=239 RepID=UPI0037C16BBB